MDDNTVKCVLVVLAVVLVGYLLVSYMNNDSNVVSEESFEGFTDGEDAQYQGGIAPANPHGENESPKEIGQEEATQFNETPDECYPKEILTSAELLPTDANSMWAAANPATAGSLTDKNFLNAGYHVGINTVGQSLRNGNLQLRSEPPNPQSKVSPWMQSTIEPDINRRPLEIGCGSQ